MGYYRDTTGNLDIDPSTADIVHHVFSMRAKHLSYRKIYQKLDTLLSAQNLPNPVASHVSIGKILKNRTYVGEVKYSGNWKKGLHQPIISKRLFNSVQTWFIPNTPQWNKRKPVLIYIYMGEVEII